MRDCCSGFDNNDRVRLLFWLVHVGRYSQCEVHRGSDDARVSVLNKTYPIDHSALSWPTAQQIRDSQTAALLPLLAVPPQDSIRGSYTYTMAQLERRFYNLLERHESNHDPGNLWSLSSLVLLSCLSNRIVVPIEPLYTRAHGCGTTMGNLTMSLHWRSRSASEIIPASATNCESRICCVVGQCATNL